MNQRQGMAGSIALDIPSDTSCNKYQESKLVLSAGDEVTSKIIFEISNGLVIIVFQKKEAVNLKNTFILIRSSFLVSGHGFQSEIVNRSNNKEKER